MAGVFQRGNVAKLRDLFEKRGGGEEEGKTQGVDGAADTKGVPGGVALPGLTRVTRKDSASPSANANETTWYAMSQRTCVLAD